MYVRDAIRNKILNDRVFDVNGHNVTYSDVPQPTTPCLMNGVGSPHGLVRDMHKHNCEYTPALLQIDVETYLKQVNHTLPQGLICPGINVHNNHNNKYINSGMVGRKQMIKTFHEHHRSFLTPDTPAVFNNATSTKMKYDQVRCTYA